MACRSLHFGLNDYTAQRDAGLGGTFRNLMGCQNDALTWRAFAETRLGIPARDQQLFTTPREITKARVLGEIGALMTALRPGDACLVTYSGHGVQVPTYSPVHMEPDGLDECLVTFDFTWEDPLRDDDLARVLATRPKDSYCLLVIDTCHSGSITRAAGPELEDPLVRAVIPPPALVPDLLRGDAARRSGYREPFSGSGFGPLGPDDDSDGLVVFSACLSNELARETYFDGVFRGAFSLLLQQAIESAGIDSPLEDLVQITLERLRAMGHTHQTPQLETREDMRRRPLWSVAPPGGEVRP